MAMSLGRGGTNLKPDYTSRLGEQMAKRSAEASTDEVKKEIQVENASTKEAATEAPAEKSISSEASQESKATAEASIRAEEKPKKAPVPKPKQTVSNDMRKNMERLQNIVDNDKRGRYSFMMSASLRELLSFYCVPAARTENMSDIVEIALIEYFSKEEVFNDPAFQSALTLLSNNA